MLVWELCEGVYSVVNAVVNSTRIKIEYQAERDRLVFLIKQNEERISFLSCHFRNFDIEKW